ncbi:HAMP domain-containing histidine kinase [Candidatus Gracilibacteria bacterium]|nr:HAMP domain-containing histidine kinase [Candidatus Gracilibacteria bacterium]
MKDYLKSSERKLVASFVIGALIFLMVFEGVFLVTRYFIEIQTHEENFIKETDSIVNHTTLLSTQSISFVIGIEAIQTNSSGQILSSQIKNLTIENISDILDEDTLEDIDESSNHMAYADDYIVRRIAQNNVTTFFFTRPRINLHTMQRDAIRFLLLDMLLILPLWFLMRFHIRRTLLPVRENIDTMTHFVHDAGHELKTPLAIISGNLQILRDSPKMDYELVESSLDTIDAMNESISGLLELADLKIPEKNKKTNILPIVESEIFRAKNIKNVTIENNLTKDFYVSASEKHLSILIRNLLENAIKYNKENGRVMISSEKNIFTIRDTGIGMAKDDIDRIFDRFYRINQNSSITGSGIGMTLVDKILKLYDWDIKIQSQVDEGTEIRIIFPK